jgi:hypothetical protein
MHIDVCIGVPKIPTPAARASLAAAAAGQPQLAVLYAMNDKLSKENAGEAGCFVNSITCNVISVVHLTLDGVNGK